MNHSSVQSLHFVFSQTNTSRLLNPGDVIICQRISGANNIMFGNGVILNSGETIGWTKSN